MLAKHRDNFKIITEWAVRVDDLRRALLNYQPHIVHFSGHGSGSTGLILEDNSGQVQLVTTASLARLFKSFQDSVECVLLNACYSEAQAQAIHEHIDYVIGMNRAIGDRAAIEFAIGFYDALGAGRPYENCFELGCASIDLEGIPESETPVLKARRRRNQTELETNLGGVVSGKSKTQEQSNSQLRYGGISQSISGGTMYDGIQAAQGNQKQQTQETKVTASEEKSS
uniref:CHAT domain-containing protein n=1 Tax=Hassallia byssoidea TaxID=482630 RepID=UPI000B328685